MKLYMMRGCPYGHRAVMALREKKLEHEVVFYEKSARPPELDAAGPMAKSPTLFDQGFAVYDSTVVLEYLEDRFAHPSLLPGHVDGRAKARMFVARATEFGAKSGALTMAALTNDDAKAETAREALLAALPALDEHFSKQQYAVPDGFSLADITLYTFFANLPAAARFEVPAKHKHLRAWIDRVGARPSAAVPAPTKGAR